MKWKCSECGNEWEAEISEEYSFLSEKYSDDPASHCKVCQEESELKKRAIVIINQVDVAMDIAYAYAKAERTHFVATGQEVDIVQVMNMKATCGSVYDIANYRGISPMISLATAISLCSSDNYVPKVGEKIEFDKPILFDKEPSKFFGKSKRNYRK